MVILTLLAYGVYKENTKSENVNKEPAEEHNKKIDEEREESTSRTREKGSPISARHHHPDRRRGFNHKVNLLTWKQKPLFHTYTYFQTF